MSLQLQYRHKGRIDQIIRRMRQLKQHAVCGIGASQQVSLDQQTHSAGHLAACYEYGARALLIPAQPFVAPFIQQQQRQLLQLIAQQNLLLLFGKKTLQHLLEQSAQKMAQDLKKRIAASSFKPAQISLKTAEVGSKTATAKFKSTQLIDVSELLQKAVFYRVGN